MCVCMCVLILSVILWTSWICGLLLFINFRKFLAISPSNISSTLLCPLSTWKSSVYVRTFAIISQLLDALFHVFYSFWISSSTTLEENCLSPKNLVPYFKLISYTPESLLPNIWWPLDYSVPCDALTGNYMDTETESLICSCRFFLYNKIRSRHKELSNLAKVTQLVSGGVRLTGSRDYVCTL